MGRKKSSEDHRDPAKENLPDTVEGAASADNTPTSPPDSPENPAADAGDPPPAEEDCQKDPLAELEAALAAEKNKYLRLAAEFDNYRKRSQKERENIYGDTCCNIVTKFLPVYDNLERALKQETADNAFYKGVEMIMVQLNEILESIGVSEIPAMGEVFDPALHNAVFHVDDDHYGDGEIVEAFQKGFKMGDKVIRFSMVKVAN